MVNIYGWNVEGDSPYAIIRSGVVPAVKKWLSGERLPSTWSFSADSGHAAAIQAKLPRLQQTARDMVGRGRDPRAISPVLESFQKEFEPLVKSGKMAEAEAAIDRAIARLQALP